MAAARLEAESLEESGHAENLAQGNIQLLADFNQYVLRNIIELCLDILQQRNQLFFFIDVAVNKSFNFCGFTGNKRLNRGYIQRSIHRYTS